MFQHRLFSSGSLTALAVVTIGVLMSGSQAGAQVLSVIGDDFESYTPNTPNTPVAPYSFSDVDPMISTQVLPGVGVGGSQALELQFNMTTGATLNTGMRYPRPAMNNTSSNRAKYTLSFDLALVSGVTAGFFSSPKIELFSNNGVNASGFLIDQSLLTPGGGYQHYSYLLSEADEITFGHTQHVDPTVATLDVAFVFLGFPAGADSIDQTYLVDNLKIEIAPPPVVDLTLLVNKTTEQVSIRNDSANPVSFDYYKIESAMNALSPAGWNSLDDQGIGGLPTDFDGNGTVGGSDLPIWQASYGANAGGDADGDGDSDGRDFLAWQRDFGSTPGPADSWIEAGGSSASGIGELLLNGATVLNPGEALSLGAAYDNSIFGAANGDLIFNVSTGDSTALGLGQVVYTTAPLTANIAVPEPASVVLCALAVAVFAWKRQ
jgi:hypothetical protein